MEPTGSDTRERPSSNSQITDAQSDPFLFQKFLKNIGDETSSIASASSSVGADDLAAPSPQITEWLKLGTVRAMSPEILLSQLLHHESPRAWVSHAETPEWADQPLSLVLLDIRSAQDFRISHLKGSLNPSFPLLVLKRFKKGMFSNFQLQNFVADGEQKELLNSWNATHSESDPICVVVYDSQMRHTAEDGNAWVVLSALASGMSNELLTSLSCSSSRHPRMILSYLNGGYSAFVQLSESAKFTTGLSPAPSSHVNMEAAGSVTSSTEDVNPKKQALGKKNGSYMKKSGLNLKIGGNGKKDSSSNLTISIKPEIDCSRPNNPLTASPNDNAAPPEPFSRITKNIIVGSDLLPLSQDGPKLLQDIGVTHILNMAAEIPNNPIVQECGLFNLKWIPVYDNTEVNLDSSLQEAISFMSDAISANPDAIIFVHCKAGRSRSVSVVIGFLVAVEKYTLQSAYELVQKTRKGVSPNLGFMAALMKVEKDTHGENTGLY